MVTIALAALPMPGTTDTGRTLHAQPENYRGLVSTLKPGDILLLDPGEYLHGLNVHALNGSARHPIVIAARDRQRAVILRGRSGRNTISIVDSSHVVIRDLLLDGDGLSVDGVKCEGHARWAHHIALERLDIVGHGADQSLVGISTKCPAWDWTIRDVRIVGAGTGLYLGNSDGSAPFVRGLIERLQVIDPIGYALQIKHQTVRPKLDGMPGEASVTVIRNSTFLKSGGSAGERARPSVLLGHFPKHGVGAADRYLVHGNLFFGNPTEALFQAEGNVALYNNLLVNHAGDAVRIQPHKDVPRDIVVTHNTVVASGTGVSLTGAAPGHRQLVAGNAVFAGRPFATLVVGENFGAPYDRAAAYLTRPTAALADIDLAPRPGKLHFRGAPLAAGDELPASATDYRHLPLDVPVFGACQPARAGVRPCR